MQNTRKRNKPPKAKWIADRNSALEKLPERNTSKKQTPINFYLVINLMQLQNGLLMNLVKVFGIMRIAK